MGTTNNINLNDLDFTDMEIEEIHRLAEELLEHRKYSLLRQMLNNLNSADIALLFDEMDKKEIPLLYRLLPKEEAADSFSYMSREMQKTLINTLTDRELRAVMDDIFLDDTVDMIEEMPANVVARILRNTDEETRKMINQVLNYPKDSAGSLMTIEYVNIKRNDCRRSHQPYPPYCRQQRNGLHLLRDRTPETNRHGIGKRPADGRRLHAD